MRTNAVMNGPNVFQFFLISTFHITCDKEVGVIGVDVSKEHLITSRGRVRKYENDLKGYEEILKNFMVSRS